MAGGFMPPSLDMTSPSPQSAGGASSAQQQQQTPSLKNSVLSALMRGGASSSSSTPRNTSNYLSAADTSVESSKPPITPVVAQVKEKSAMSLFQGDAFRFVVEERIRARCLGNGRIGFVIAALCLFTLIPVV
jgi:hypothetical protein